jgi:hypothetical protein
MLGVLAAAGCMGALHPIHSLPKEACLAAPQLPPCCRDHVYIFLVHGLDPLDYANLAGLRDYLISLGYIKTYQGQTYHAFFFAKEFRRLHQEDPDARCVLVGFSFGANVACKLAKLAGDAGMPVDLLVYLGGNTLKNVPRDRPEHVVKIVNILSKGCIWNGAQLDGAENVEYTDCYHFGSPSHPHTLDVLAHELAMVACRVPVTDHGPRTAAAEEAPTPRRLNPAPDAAESDDEWGFLKPASGIPDHARTAPIAFPAVEAPEQKVKEGS